MEWDFFGSGRGNGARKEETETILIQDVFLRVCGVGATSGNLISPCVRCVRQNMHASPRHHTAGIAGIGVRNNQSRISLNVSWQDDSLLFSDHLIRGLILILGRPLAGMIDLQVKTSDLRFRSLSGLNFFFHFQLRNLKIRSIPRRTI